MKQKLRFATCWFALVAGSAFAAQEFRFTASVDSVAGPPPFDGSVQIGSLVQGRFVIDHQTSSLSPLVVPYSGTPFLVEAQVGDYAFVANTFRVAVTDNELGVSDEYSLESFTATLTGPATSLEGQHLTLGLHGPTTVYTGQSLSTLPAEFSLYTLGVLDLANLRATVVSLAPVPEPATIVLACVGLGFYRLRVFRKGPAAG